MIRMGAFVLGLFFAGWLAVSALMGAYSWYAEPPKPTAEHEFHKHPRKAGFSFEGPMGKFDQPQLQRGFQVFKEVCAACHGLRHVSFRDLEGIGYSPAQVKAIAGEWQIEVPAINQDTGEATTRKATPQDKFPSPYANEVAAKQANNGANPPDLSLMAKARHDGANYTYSLLTGYQNPDPRLLKEFPDSKPGKTTYHNPYFANLNIGMPAPITSDGQVQYGEGAPKPTVDQMSKDVSAFLMWTAEPKMEIRRNVGAVALVFIAIFGWLCWLAYQNVWADLKRRDEEAVS
jgi:ubiquinol-cytochrome c reductase cytochrome c1 subunit